MTTARQLNVADPGDAEIQYAWDAWMGALSRATWSGEAAEWRQMYLGLLALRAARQASEQFPYGISRNSRLYAWECEEDPGEEGS